MGYQEDLNKTVGSLMGSCKDRLTNENREQDKVQVNYKIRKIK
jgi:hypothetical protein